MAGKLADEVALVTGSTSGIGQGIAQVFAQEGAKVVVTGRRKEQGEKIAAEIRDKGGRAVYVFGDLSQRETPQQLVASAQQEYGSIDILVNNAMSWAVSWGAGAEFVEQSRSAWDDMLEVGLTAPAELTRQVLPHMIEQQHGSIVNISSIRAFRVQPKGSAYDVVKAGLINLTRSIALDYGRYGIRANTICPGLILSEQAEQQWRQDPKRCRFIEMHPAGRAGRPEDIARLAVYLCSRDAAWVTGATMVIDGGLTLGTPS